jgi:hypothetical protein
MASVQQPPSFGIEEIKPHRRISPLVASEIERIDEVKPPKSRFDGPYQQAKLSEQVA